jgi:hypothetical protein
MKKLFHAGIKIGVAGWLGCMGIAAAHAKPRVIQQPKLDEVCRQQGRMVVPTLPGAGFKEFVAAHDCIIDGHRISFGK